MLKYCSFNREHLFKAISLLPPMDPYDESNGPSGWKFSRIGSLWVDLFITSEQAITLTQNGIPVEINHDV